MKHERGQENKRHSAQKKVRTLLTYIVRHGVVVEQAVQRLQRRGVFTSGEVERQTVIVVRGQVRGGRRRLFHLYNNVTRRELG